MGFPFITVNDRDRGVASMTVYNGDQTIVVDSTSKSYQSIVDAVRSGATWEEITGLLSQEGYVRQALEPLSERVAVANGNVYFDGDAVDKSIANLILQFLAEGNDQWEALVNFLEKVNQNPSERSREQLFAWLSAREFTITPDGDFLGYKGTRSDFTSINAGYGFVDGVRVEKVTNKVGSVITFPRSEVDDDPNSACSTGLHVGTYDYASSFAQGKLLLVKVNPRDVVSVPHDSSSQKIRTCRYTVVEVYDAPEPIRTATYFNEDWDEDDDDYCPECDSYLPYGTDECRVCEASIRAEEAYDAARYAQTVAATPTQEQLDATTVRAKAWRSTNTNYLNQKRGPGGRFLPKNS